MYSEACIVHRKMSYPVWNGVYWRVGIEYMLYSIVLYKGGKSENTHAFMSYLE